MEGIFRALEDHARLVGGITTLTAAEKADILQTIANSYSQLLWGAQGGRWASSTETDYHYRSGALDEKRPAGFTKEEQHA